MNEKIITPECMAFLKEKGTDTVYAMRMMIYCTKYQIPLMLIMPELIQLIATFHETNNTGITFEKIIETL